FMRSMTGYGRGACEAAGRRLVVELRSVNHRFLEVKLRLPWSDPVLEAGVAQFLRRKFHRGAISASVCEEAGGATQAVRADLGLARACANAIAEVQRALEQPGPVPLELVCAQPGVLSAGEAALDAEALLAALEPGLEEAARMLSESRAREGAAMAEDLR